VRRALVLGGGGPIGIAWETALATQLRELGVELRDADCVVGTSAGSLVGTRIAAGHDVAIEPEGGGRLGMPRPEGGFDRERLREIFAIWNEVGDPDALGAARRREIGALARRARTAPLEDWIAASGQAIGVPDWPERALCIAAIDVDRGDRVVFDRASGVPLAHAIAASCAVPGLFPLVPIGESAYMDGGVGSTTNADAALAHAPDVVLIVAPACDPTRTAGACAARFVEREAAQIEAAGVRCLAVLPTAADVAAFGPDLMNPLRIGRALERGRARAREIANELRAIWHP